MYVQYLYLANGIFDIACGLVVLSGVDPVWHIHHDLFTPEHQSPIFARLMAYWTITYGFARLGAGVDSNLLALAAITYVLEAVYYEYEYRAGTVKFGWKARFISITSLALAVPVGRAFCRSHEPTESWSGLSRAAREYAD